MKSFTLSGFISLLISISILNDVILFDVISLAKIVSLLGVFFLLYHGFILSRIRKCDIVVFSYCLILILISVFLSGGEISDRTAAIITSLAIGLLFYFIITKSKIGLSKYTKSYVLVCLVGLCVSVVQTITGELFFTNRIFMSELVPGLYRASGFMSDPNYFGLTLLIGYCFIDYSFKSKTVLIKVIFSIGVVLTGSRSVLLSFVLLVVAEKYAHKLNVFNLIVLSILLCLILLLCFYFREYLPTSLSMVFDPQSYSSEVQRNSLSDRMLVIDLAVTVFKSYPFFGYGLGNLVYFPLNIHGQMSHNTYLEILAESGLVGFALFFILIVYYLRLSFLVREPKLKALTFMLLFVFLLMSMTLVTHYSRLLFYMLSILSIAYKDDTHEKNKN